MIHATALVHPNAKVAADVEIGADAIVGEHVDRGCGTVIFFSSRRRHTRLQGDWSSDVCSSDLCLMSPMMPLACRHFISWPTSFPARMGSSPLYSKLRPLRGSRVMFTPPPRDMV